MYVESAGLMISQCKKNKIKTW